MMQEPFDEQDTGKRKRSDEWQSEPVEYVGAPTEYADAEEVPEAISLLAKIMAGGVLTWIVVGGILAVVAFGCAVCFMLAFGSGLLLQ